MKNTLLLAGILMLASCAEKTSLKHVPIIGGPFEALEFEELDLDPGNDSLWYHLVMNLPGEGLLAVAQPISDENRRGIRFQLLDMNPDSSFSCNGESSPGYDSAKLYPTIFKNAMGQYLILADTGERNSWGLKVYCLENGLFTDLGFIDMGTTDSELNEDIGEMEVAPKSIAPYVRVNVADGELTFSFDCESLRVFDDRTGELDKVYPCNAWTYHYSSTGEWSMISH